MKEEKTPGCRRHLLAWIVEIMRDDQLDRPPFTIVVNSKAPCTCPGSTSADDKSRPRSP